MLGGSLPDGFDRGAYVAPTLFTGMHNDMQTAMEEIFGPVGAVLSFSSIDEAVKIANDGSPLFSVGNLIGWYSPV